MQITGGHYEKDVKRHRRNAGAIVLYSHVYKRCLCYRIAVGQDGILRTELGNSGSYVLSCLTLNAAVPAPGDIPSPDVTQQEQNTQTTDSAENADAASQNAQEQDSGRPTVGGIPVMHISVANASDIAGNSACIGRKNEICWREEKCENCVTASYHVFFA